MLCCNQTCFSVASGSLSRFWMIMCCVSLLEINTVRCDSGWSATILAIYLPITSAGEMHFSPDMWLADQLTANLTNEEGAANIHAHTVTQHTMFRTSAAQIFQQLFPSTKKTKKPKISKSSNCSKKKKMLKAGRDFNIFKQLIRLCSWVCSMLLQKEFCAV